MSLSSRIRNYLASAGLAAGALLYSPISGARQHRVYAEDKPIQAALTVDDHRKAFLATTLSLDDRIKAANTFADADTDAFLAAMYAERGAERLTKKDAPLLISLALQEPIPHIRHLEFVRAYRLDAQTLLREIKKTATASDEDFFRRMYSIEFCGRN